MLRDIPYDATGFDCVHTTLAAITDFSRHEVETALAAGALVGEMSGWQNVGKDNLGSLVTAIRSTGRTVAPIHDFTQRPYAERPSISTYLAEQAEADRATLVIIHGESEDRTIRHVLAAEKGQLVDCNLGQHRVPTTTPIPHEIDCLHVKWVLRVDTEDVTDS